MLNSKEKKSNLEMFIKLITGHFNNTNTVITGNPAKIIKSGVIWTHKKSNHRINYIIKVTSWEHF